MKETFKGLSSEEAKVLLEENGFNELTGGKKKSKIRIFAEQFMDFLIIILIVDKLLFQHHY